MINKSGVQKRSWDEWLFSSAKHIINRFCEVTFKCCLDCSFLLWKTIMWERFPVAYLFYSIPGIGFNWVWCDDRHGDNCLWKKSFLLIVPERRARATPSRTTWGSTRVGQEAEGMREKCGPELVLWFFMRKEAMRQDRLAEQVWDWAVWTVFSRVWAIGVVPSCQKRGPRVIVGSGIKP